MTDAETQEDRDARFARVRESHERAVGLRKRLVPFIGTGGVWTNRYPGSDTQHIVLDQEAAAAILAHLEGV